MAKDKPTKIASKKHLARQERERRQIKLITTVAIGLVVVIVGLIGYGILYETVLKALQPVVTVDGDSVSMREFQMRVRSARQQYIDRYMQYYDQLSQYNQFAQMLGIDPATDPSMSQTLNQLQSQMNQIQSQLANPSLIGQQVIEDITNDLLIRQFAKANGILVTKADVEKAIQDAFGYYPDGTPTPSPTGTPLTYSTLSATQYALLTPTVVTPLAPAETPSITETLVSTETPSLTHTSDLTATATIIPSPTSTATPTTVPSISPTATVTTVPSLTSTATPYTLDGFQSRYKEGLSFYSKLGMTETEFRKIFFESQIYRQRVSDIVTANVAHEQEQVWARHILVADEAAAQDIHTQLLAGVDFATLAATFSIDPGTKDSGGDLGWFGKGRMIAEFENVAFALQVGEFSQPLQTTEGWHIVQVLGHEIRPLSDIEYTDAATANLIQWLTDQRTGATIIISSNWTDNIPDLPSLDGAFADLYSTATAYANQALQQPSSTPTP